ncbi:hypothetical protein PVV23_25970, partial [Salmonella enterica subsp. enterica serovar Typhimurium]|uniref:hypothetical protein n=1 Tax=Salmonella enterica TaxID=28901 RepID=UPI002FF76E72
LVQPLVFFGVSDSVKGLARSALRRISAARANFSVERQPVRVDLRNPRFEVRLLEWIGWPGP